MSCLLEPMVKPSFHENMYGLPLTQLKRSFYQMHIMVLIYEEGKIMGHALWEQERVR